MLFHVFDSQEERRSFGGSAFMEMQFCKWPSGTAVEKIVAVNSINHWQNDSLYVDDEDVFYQEYGHIFDCGIYNDLKKGTVDIHGINYYAPSLVDSIIARIQKEKPAAYDVMIEWLIKSKEYNGFYILGM
ncbi:MAG: hypothetical protein IJ012_01965 [Clostridia bacterium]|nr:hypothetical protein [Clostridia bacterium]